MKEARWNAAGILKKLKSSNKKAFNNFKESLIDIFENVKWICLGDDTVSFSARGYTSVSADEDMIESLASVANDLKTGEMMITDTHNCTSSEIYYRFGKIVCYRGNFEEVAQKVGQGWPFVEEDEGEDE